MDEQFIKENDMLLSIFLWQINNHCYDAGGSYEDLKNVMTKGLDEDSLRQYIWNNVQEFLSESALLSKILFPSSKRSFSKKRAETLLSLLELDNNKAGNLQSRELRNRTEHFDEDLDKWWQVNKSSSRKWNQLAIKAIDGLDDDVIYAPNAQLAFMYNPSTGIVYHLDEEFNIHGIFEDIVAVSKSLKSAFSKLNQIAGTNITRVSR